MNLHLLFSAQVSVVGNMQKLIQNGDIVLLLDEAISLLSSPTINTWPCKSLLALESQLRSDTGAITTISTQQWVELSESAHLIYSWY